MLKKSLLGAVLLVSLNTLAFAGSANTSKISTAIPASYKAVSQKTVPAFSQLEHEPAGAATVERLHLRSYVYPLANISRMKQLDFWTGFSLFRDPWIAAPAVTADRDGLGPLFITRSCITCHHAGGRGPMSQPGEHQPSSLLLRLGSTIAGVNQVDPNYGGQIQPRAIKLKHPSLKKQAQAEAWLDLKYQTINGTFADGTPYQLQQPTYQLTKLSHGPLADNIGLSPRYAPNIYGMGLLDAINERDLLAQADPSDSNNNGISGRYNRVTDVASGNKKAIGRFGFKAKHPTLDQQVAAAFVGDIGITSPLFPNENCTSEQTGCQQASAFGQQFDQQGAPEIPQKLLKLVNDFSAYISVPPARALENKQTQRGRSLFYQSGCANCHAPSYVTNSDYPVSELANLTIWPYTDLALHDMGTALADGITEFSANGQEWRTPPLWGIGLQQKISGSNHFLHDGRARSISEAILWHGGEAAPAKQKYLTMEQADRAALLRFIKSI